MTRVVCQQFGPVLGDVDGNVRRCTQAVAAAVAGGADVVVLPELATSGYVFASTEEARAAAVERTSEVFAAWAAAAGDATVVGGFCERDGDAVYNSAAVVDRTGVRAIHRKTHLWDRETLVFAAGDAPPPVVETRHGRLGVLICYELEFPELPRHLALGGVDLIAVPTNWPLEPRPVGEHPAEVQIAMAAARVNHVFIACCDRTGVERGQAWTQGTVVVGTDGWILARQAQEGAAQADLELSDARRKHRAGFVDVLADRRPELYGRLVETGTA